MDTREQLLFMTEWQIDPTDKIFDEADLRQGSLHAEELGLAPRYSWAASTIGNSVGIGLGELRTCSVALV